MLRWRLILGPLIIVFLTALAWADAHAERPGIWFLPLAVVLCLLATQEMLRLFRAGGSWPLAWTVYGGTLLPLLAACAPIAWLQYPENCPIGRLGWLAGGIVAGLLVALVGEMSRYPNASAINGPNASAINGSNADAIDGPNADPINGPGQPAAPGQATAALASAALSVLYIGGLLGFLVQLRLLPVAGDVARGGLLSLLSMIIVVKATDIGAYTAGRLWGRHKLAPALSPGKTWEGVAGGLVFALAGALVSLGPLAAALGMASNRGWYAWVGSASIYALLVSVAGIIGDLAESLFKRDAGVKDSSTWLPGFGGILDLLDSLLVAAPVAYFCWICGLLGY